MDEYRELARRRHQEALQRRREAAAEGADTPSPPDADAAGRPPEWDALPQSVSSLVLCGHAASPGVRCPDCAGLEPVAGDDARRACGVHVRVYRGLDPAAAHELSDRDKAARRLDDRRSEASRALVYGEVEFWPFAHLVRHGLAVRDGDVFTDLGSGSGRAVLAAALLHPGLAVARGVELLPRLHAAAQGRADEMRRELEGLARGPSAGAAAPVELVCGDVMEWPWWRDTTAAFAACTGFSDDMMARVAQLAERMPAGARVVTYSRPLPSTAFRVTLCRKYRVSWGNVTVFVQQLGA